MSFIYVFFTLDLIWRCKVGITRTQSVDERRKGVEASMSNSLGKNIVLRWAIYAPMLLNERAEKRIHRWLSPLRYNGLKPEVSGYTEWFWFFNPLTACLGIYLGVRYGVFTEAQGLDAYSAWWLVVCFAPIPFDVMVLVAFAALLEYSIILALVGGIGFVGLKLLPNV